MFYCSPKSIFANPYLFFCFIRFLFFFFSEKSSVFFAKKKYHTFFITFCFCSSRFVFTSVFRIRFCLIFCFLDLLLHELIFLLLHFLQFFLWTTITLLFCIKKTFQKFPSYMHALPLHVLLVLTHLFICCLSSLFLFSITFVFLFLLLFSLSKTFFSKQVYGNSANLKKKLVCSFPLFRWARFHMYLSLHVCPSFCFSNFPFVLFSCVFKHFSFLFSFRNVFLLVLLLKC